MDADFLAKATSHMDKALRQDYGGEPEYYSYSPPMVLSVGEDTVRHAAHLRVLHKQHAVYCCGWEP